MGAFLELISDFSKKTSWKCYETFLVALVWMGCTVLLPVYDNQLLVSWDIWVLMIQRFLLVLILLFKSILPILSTSFTLIL